MAAQREYANALTYINIYHSDECWRTVTKARKEYSKLTSKTAQLNAVKEQIKIQVVGFGWKDLHHPWSRNGIVYSPEQLRDYLINSIIPEQKKRKIPKQPTVNLPSRGDRNQLGTESLDVKILKQKCKKEKQVVIIGGEAMRNRMENDEKVDRYEILQGPKPNVDETLINAKIEMLWEFIEEDGTAVPQWCQGIVVAVRKNDKVHIKWNKNCLREGEHPVSQERLLKSKWNKHVEKGWRMNLD